MNICLLVPSTLLLLLLHLRFVLLCWIQGCEKSESNVRLAYLSSLSSLVSLQRKMLDRGDLDLNTIQSCTDSLKDRLKQTMLDQELVFMTQVYELHRLYNIQMAMAEDYKRKQSVDLNNQAKCPMGEIKLSESFNSQNELQQHRLPGFLKKPPIDLQLSADEFISHCNDFSVRESIELKNSSRGEVVFDPNNLKLSLSIGQDDSKKSEEDRLWMKKKICASSSNVIDLEDPKLGFSNNDSYLTLGLTSRRALVEVGPTCQKRAPCDFSGNNGNNKELLSADLISKNQRSGVCKANNLDLNTVQLEDSSYFSNNHSMVMNPSRITIASSSSPTSLQKPIDTHFTENSDIHRERDGNCDLSVSYKDKERENQSKDAEFIEDGGKMSCIDLDSEEELCSSRSDPKIESVDSSTKLSKGLSFDINQCYSVGEAELERESDEEPNHQSSSIKTMQSGTKCGDLNSSSSDLSQKANMGSLPTAHLGEPDQRSSDSSESNIQSIDRIEPEVDETVQKLAPTAHSSGSSESNIQSTDRKEPEVDETVRTLAQILVQISGETQPNVGPSKEVRNEEEDDQPQCSSESYEALVMREKECGPDEYCVSSSAFFVDEREKKDVMYKLKRGSRMKDFQKDILPCLSTLSRHEIREDVNILEGVIRSREYKRMRAKTGAGAGDYCRPVRSKRSRVSYARRFDL